MPANASRKPSSSSIHSGVHSPARQSPDPLSNVQHHRNLSPNSTGMLNARLHGWPAWSSSNASSDNLTNRTASVSSPSSLVDSAPLTDSPHRSPLNTGWDINPKAATLGSRGYPASSEWDYMANSPSREQSPTEIQQPNHIPVRSRTQHLASVQSTALSASQNPQGTGPRYPSNVPLKPTTQHASFGSNASNHSTGLVPTHFDSLSSNDTEAQLANNMRALGLDESAVDSAYNPGHGRAVSHAGAFTVASGMPMPAPPTPTSHAPRSVSLQQPHDPSYNFDLSTAVYYPNVPSSNFNQYQFNTHRADLSYSSPVVSTSHSIPFMGNYAGQASYYYAAPPPAMMYSSPPMGHTPVSGTMHPRMLTMPHPKLDLQGAPFAPAHLTHQERMQMSGTPSNGRSGFNITSRMAGPNQGHNNMRQQQQHSQPVYGFHPHVVRPVVFAQAQLDPSVAGRSPLLEQFRADKSKTWQLLDIRGHVTEFCGDQHGSRFIQQKLEGATDDEKEAIFVELVPDDGVLSLMTDVFGNYVIQKLFEFGSEEQKDLLVSIMKGHMLALSLQMYGCRVVQKAIECISPEQQAAFVREIDTDVMRCVKDANGNHVIQKLIERVSPDLLGFVSAFQGNVYDLATHPYGCRVLQRCFEYLHESQTRPLTDELHKYTTQLMQDQFGNYVIQFVLEHGAPADREWILHKLRGQMVQMAKHKFASNVCEKALVMADPESRRLLIEELMAPRPDVVNPIVLLMKDSFGNYVLQRALQVVEGEQRQVLVSKVKPQLNNMRRYSSAYSKHLASIEKLLNERPSDEASLLRGLHSSDAPAHSTLGSTSS